MIYNSNFDDQAFQNVNHREFNKTIDDPCAIQQRNTDNNKKLKYITTNHIDLLEAKDKLNFFGIALQDHLFVPNDQMDGDSAMRLGEKGNILTNCNIKNEYGQLPFPTMPYKGQLSRGDIDTEDSIRNFIDVKKHSCLPNDNNFHNRYFYIFDNESVEEPNALKSVEPVRRGGISTRFDRLK